MSVRQLRAFLLVVARHQYADTAKRGALDRAKVDGVHGTAISKVASVGVHGAVDFVAW